MSKPSPTTIACTGCGTKAPFVAWESLNVSLNPDEKESLLKGELTRFTCEKCGWSGQVIHPLLYHDMRQQFMVWLMPNPESKMEDAGFRESMKGYRLRRVANLNELKEKVYLFDAGLDDRQMEVLKLIIEMRSVQTADRLTGPLLFSEQGTSEDGETILRFAHLGADGIKSLTVSVDSLAEVAASLDGRLPSEENLGAVWPTVDRAYAMEVMKTVGQQAQQEGSEG